MLSAQEFKAYKGKKKFSLLTCYDYQMALWMSKTRLDAVLVGDSLAQVLYGMEYTSEISIETMLLHTQAVRKGLPSIHLIGDMPYLANSKDSIDKSDVVSKVVDYAKRFSEAGVNSIKLENPDSDVVKAIIDLGIPVCGHVGLTPQTMHDFKKQGKDEQSAKAIVENAIRLDRLGCYGLVLEAIPEELAKTITDEISAITIGIASGKKCDAQILVSYDLLGLTFHPRKFITPQANLGDEIIAAVERYIQSNQNHESGSTT